MGKHVLLFLLSFGKTHVFRLATSTCSAAFIYLSIWNNENQTFPATHLGAFTLLALWWNVALSLGMLLPSLGIYISITNYVGWEVLRLILLYSTTLIGSSNQDTTYNSKQLIATST